MVEAFESERQTLLARNAELGSQVKALTRSLIDSRNFTASIATAVEAEAAGPLSESREGGEGAVLKKVHSTPTARAMLDKITVQERAIEELTLQLVAAHDTVGALQKEKSALVEVADNLRIELDSRPTVRSP